MVCLLKTKNELKRLCRLEIQTLFTKMNWIKLVFDMIWLTVHKKIWQKELNHKGLRDRAFKIASNPKYDNYQRELAEIKKSSENGVDALLVNKSATEPNYQLANELHKQIIRKFKRRKIYSCFRDYIWGVDLADMQPLSKYN